MPMPVIAPALLDKYDTAGPRYTSYPPVPDWSSDVTDADYRQALHEMANGDLALYMHMPFCAARCLYCGCAATVTTRTDVVSSYLLRLENEMRMVTDAIARKPLLRELHWGGGTPNFLADGQLVRAFDMVAEHFELAPDFECSIEADPRLVTTTQLRWLHGLGFDRISFGVQDLDPVVQQGIGRVQSVELVTDVVERAREQGFGSINLDVLYGLPYQTRASFDDTLQAVIELSPDRVACFGYAHVPWMRPHQRRMNEAALPDRSLRFELYQLAVERFTEAGYVWIGFDHFAKADDPMAIAAESGQLHRDFMGYTTRQSRALLGLGMSAIGEVGDLYVQNEAQLGDWQRAVDAGRLPFVRGHRLSTEDRARGNVIREILCNAVVQREALPDDAGATLDRFRVFESDGLVLIGEDTITVTPTGRFFLRNLAMALDSYRHQSASDSDSSPRFSRTV